MSSRHGLHHPRATRHARHHRNHPVWRGVGLTVVAALAFGSSAVAAVTHRWNANLTRSHAMDLVPKGPDGPADAAHGKDLNILLLGSDSRDGENAQIGGQDSGRRSDVTIVMHVSADRKRVELVSIPRDSLVDIPTCSMRDGSTTPPTSGAMINEAFSRGWQHGGTTDTERFDSAVGCSITTVRANTGLAIDHFAVVDFVGFQGMVDALHGVDVCIEHDMKDTKFTGLDLKAGYQHLDGTQALALARSRHAYADGMDTSRIGSQQMLLAALADEALSKGAGDAPQLLSFVNQATRSLVVDDELDPGNLAWSLRGVHADSITFWTIPWQLSPQNVNRVVWTSQAADVWAAMAADTPVADVLQPADQTADPTGPTPDETAPSADPALPEQITSVADQAQQAAACPA